MSDQPNASSGASDSSSGSGSGSGSNTPKAIASLAKKQGDVTRLGTQKLKFVPTLPSRRVKDKHHPLTRTLRRKNLPPPHPPSAVVAAAEVQIVEEVATADVAAGGAKAEGPGGAARLGAGLTQTTAPSLKRERDADPDEGVEIVDMENVHQMDWMAPESLMKERETGKKKKGTKVKKEKEEESKGKGVASGDAMDVDRSQPPEEEQVNMANTVDLSESEEEEELEELEDIIDDFTQTQQEADEESDIRQERLYFFQFPRPFPVFQAPGSDNATLKGKAKEEGALGKEAGKKVTFAEDTKPSALAAAAPAAAGAPAASDKASEQPKVDGVVGQLEIYESGAVKLRVGNGIVMDVTATTQPSFLQHAVYVDHEHKRLCVLGEVNRCFVATPDIETLLTSMELAENPPTFELGDGLLTMDAT
ncbi:hypothetical protein ONZ51_g11198 [Trametes cubensis]|uniref:RNA polymerase III RPC4-domain-containing protein n=1 Tax=Trametes cubensis TaxID=1111947 RepID=A0AAD7X6I8_9APHY|nr:hypothetical protein ONZ51_g11198 [Trametes cubensis]